MLYLFDLDGTLISGYMDNPDKDYHKWEVLPGRRELLQQLDRMCHTIAIITNQGGVAFGFVSEAAAWSKIDSAIKACGLNPFAANAYVCMHDIRGKPPYNDPAEAARRKPSGAMIREVMAAYPEAVAEGVFMVGDREEDEAAARDAGVPFQWAHIFFKERP